jgi:hypothetical protein
MIQWFCHPKSAWTPTRWKNLRAIKCWATRGGHAWQMHGSILKISTANGQIHIYRELARKAVPA